jgi:dipeptidyl aminopeptidase/acylaminoacyl peptidase
MLHRTQSLLQPRAFALALAVLAAAGVMPASAAGTPTATAGSHGLQARDLESMDRFSAPTLSLDGRWVVFAKRVVDYPANTSASSLWVESLVARDAAPPSRLTPAGWNVNSPAFSPDGRTVYFLSAKAGSQQLYAIPTTGGEPRAVTALPLDVTSFRLSPDGTRVLLSADTFPDCTGDVLACTRQRLDAEAARKATGRVFDRLFIRHWDTWNDGRLSRLYAAPITATALTTATPVAADVHGDVPSKPFGDTADYAWSPDGRNVAISVRAADAREPWSTNFDIWLAPADGRGASRNLTADNPAWDASPVFSADGRTLYYRATRRPGFEADRFALMVMDLATGKHHELAPKFDVSTDSLRLSPDGNALYTTADELGQHPLFRVRLDNGEVETAVKDGSVTAFDVARGTLAYTRNSLQTGDVVYAARLDGSYPRKLTPDAAELLPGTVFAPVQQFHFIGWNNETVHGYVLKPWNYQPGRKYPVAFLIHGGPQGSFGNGWSYRWNPQTYAGQGYAVVMIDFHGSTGYGQAFTDSISGHWGDRPLEDLQKGWAAAQKQFDFIDGSNACALGASYGGYMVYWIAGNWFNRDQRSPWKCLVDHDGVFDNRMMGYSTEELWFSEWENGGTVYANEAGYERFNPARFVHNWRVPMLVVHSQQDFRVPVEQGIAAFTALQRRGIESRFLYFPDENHFVLKPQNSVLWHDTVNAWLREHLQPAAK